MLLKQRKEISCGDHVIVAEWIGEKGNGAAPLVLLNGLSDTMESWDPFLDSLSEFSGSVQRPVIRLDFRGQGASLRAELAEGGKFTAEPTVDDQVSDLLKVLEEFQVDGKIHLIGSSYGGGIALRFASRFPEWVGRVLLFVPFVIRLDQAHPLARAWSKQLDVLEQWGHWGFAAMDLGKRQYRAYLNQYMDYRYGKVLTEPVSRQAAIQLTFGILDFNALQVLDKLPSRSVHLVSVGQDTLVPQSLYDEFWSRLPESTRASWLHIADGEHLILQQAPDLCALWARKVLDGGPGLGEGRRFDSDLRSGNRAV